MHLARHFRLLLITCTLPLASQNTSDRVAVTVSVSDSKGAPVKDLRREDFTVLESGQPREVQLVGPDEPPLTVGIVADISGGKLKELKKQKDVIAAFLTGLLRPEDRAFLVTFDEDVRLVADVTRSVDDLRNAIDKLMPLTRPERLSLRKNTDQVPNRLGGTCNSLAPDTLVPRPLKPIFPCSAAAWDGVFYTADLKFKTLTGRKALIVLSHGEDGGSGHSINHAIEAARAANVVVYTVRPVDAKVKSNNNQSRSATANGLDRLAEETAGKALTTLRTPKAIFDEIGQDIHTLYVLNLTAPKAPDGKPQPLDIKVTKPGLRLRAPKLR